ncbi:MAG: HAMP domain-containing histidine kinase, partial [Bacteroidales bacterium]|nr:HAMP domain-containing histidine kinase [Bacteroidales bacterium]
NLVYATTEAGLNVIDRKTGLVTKYYKGNSSIPDDYVTDLCLTPSGAIWAATRSGLWSPSGNHFLDGMLVQCVEADEKGRLWAGTEDGLWFVDTDGSTGRVPKELGFPSEIYGERVSCHLSGGSLAFGGAAGAASFHPDSLLSIKASGNLPLESLIHHRYRLNGGDWTEGRFIGLPENIRPGRYVLQEQSSDIFGRWDRGETSEKTLRVPQPLWLRWPFLLLYALLLTGIVWTVLRLRERRLLVKELQMRNRLFSIISHDLRNPISGNRLLSRQLLERLPELPPEQLREGLEKLALSADNTSSLLENLLLWSLNQKGMLEPVMREENLKALAAEAIGTLQNGEVISVDIPSGLTVKTDRNMLLTCLRNLLDNAVKASPEGVTLKALGKRIIIADNGPGIREEDPHWGHGLGLVITRELLDKLGAGMKMQNRPEGGLEITIDL